jgi:hypothetical protein
MSGSFSEDRVLVVVPRWMSVSGAIERQIVMERFKEWSALGMPSRGPLFGAYTVRSTGPTPRDVQSARLISR